MDKDKNTEHDNADKKSSISEVYSSVIADIYAQHHVNPFTDIVKHNEGIIKAMIEFAIFYNNEQKEFCNFSTETSKFCSKYHRCDLCYMKPRTK